MDLVRTSIKILLAKLTSSAASFLAIIIFSRELGASSLGVYYPFISLLGLLSIPSNFGIRRATEKRLSEGEDLGSYLAAGISLKAPLLIITAIIILIARGYINQYLGANLAFLLILTLFVQEGAKMSLFVLRGEFRVGETAVVQIIQPLSWLVFGYAFIAWGYGVTGLVYGYLIGGTLMLLVGWLKVSIPLSRPTIQHGKSLFDYGKFSVISSSGGYFYSWMDVTVLTLFVSMGIASTRGEIGAYENAWRVSIIVLMLSKAIATTIFPQMSKWDSENATERIENILPIALLPAVLLVVPGFVGTAVLAEDILRILFTPEFAVASLALIILTGEKVLQAMHVVLGRCLIAIDRPDLAAYATVVAIFVNLVLNIILIWHFGIVGAALATAISFAVNTGLHAYYLSQFLTIRFPVQEAIWSVAASAIMGTCVYWVRSKVTVETMVHLLAVIAIGVAVYGILVLVSSRIRRRVLELADPVLPESIM